MQPIKQQLDPQAVALAKAIRDTESGGDFNARGGTGEHGAYQFMPDTWTAYAREAGVNAPFGTATPDQQNEVAYKKIKSWKDQGYNVGQIASMWNAGPGNKDAYIKGHSGVNSKGVAYDTKAYAEKVAKRYQINKGEYVGPQAGQVANQTANQPKEKLTDKLAGRANDLAEGINQPFTVGGVTRGLVRAGGAIAGGINDIVGAGLSAVTPDFIEKPITDAIGGVVGAGMNTGVGKGLMDAYGALDPELQKDLAAAGNIASLVPVGKGIGLAGKLGSEAIPTGLKVLSKGEGLVGKQASKILVKDALEIVGPKETSKVLKDAIRQGRGVAGGILRESSITPDQRTIRAAEAAAGVVKKNKTLIENAGLVKKEIEKVAVKLKSDLNNLKQGEVVPVITQPDLDELFAGTIREMSDNPLLVGEDAVIKKADTILRKFQSFLPSGRDLYADDILEARKRLDRWLESQTVGDPFNPNYETAKSVALRSIRQGANQLVADKGGSVAVKESLARQSALYDALDNISSKATKEVGTSGLKRFIDRHPTATKIGSGLVGVTATGLGINLTDDLFGK